MDAKTHAQQFELCNLKIDGAPASAFQIVRAALLMQAPLVESSAATLLTIIGVHFCAATLLLLQSGTRESLREWFSLGLFKHRAIVYPFITFTLSALLLIATLLLSALTRLILSHIPLAYTITQISSLVVLWIAMALLIIIYQTSVFTRGALHLFTGVYFLFGYRRTYNRLCKQGMSLLHSVWVVIMPVAYTLILTSPERIFNCKNCAFPGIWLNLSQE